MILFIVFFIIYYIHLSNHKFSIQNLFFTNYYLFIAILLQILHIFNHKNNF